MITIQLVILCFILFALSRVFLRFRDRIIGYRTFLFWCILWAIVLLITFKPGIADLTAHVFGIQRGSDIMFFFAVIVLFYLNFRLYVKLDILDRDLTNLTIQASKAIHRKADREEI